MNTNTSKKQEGFVLVVVAVVLSKNKEGIS